MSRTLQLLARAGFAILTATTGYLVYACLRPPHPTAKRTNNPLKDTVGQAWNLQLIKVFQHCFFAATVWQSLYIIFPSSEQPPGSYLIAPRPRQKYPLNDVLLSPNAFSFSVLATLCIVALIRIRAFSSLGSDFTFDLRVPSRLNTSGLYAYVQHPSYSAGIVAIAGGAFYFGRCDEIMGTILPDWIMRTQRVWNWLLPSLATSFIVGGVAFRVREEELMLEKAFGRKWKVWHVNTARFVPGVV